MRIGRTLPPAASPIPLSDIIHAVLTCFSKESPADTFRKQVKQELGVKNCFLLSSGKVALTSILLALKQIHPNRNKVIIPALTCYSVPAAVKRAGLQIKICDLAPSSLDFDKNILNNIIAEDHQENKILCILPTHLFGCPADIEGIKSIVGPDILIVEDAAQAMGEITDSKEIGTLGDIGFFSLGRGKALSTMEGGIVITNREDLSNILISITASFPQHHHVCKELIKTILTALFQNPSLFWLPKALPLLKLGKTLYEPVFSLSQIRPFNAALARNWKKRLEHHQQSRSRHIAYWKDHLPKSFLQTCRSRNSNMIRLPILTQTKQQRDHLLKHSDQQGLGLMPAYPTSVNNIPELTNEFSNIDCLQAEDTCNRLLTIPVHENVRHSDNKKIHALLLRD